MPGVPMMAGDDGVWSSDSSAVNTGWLYFPEEDVVWTFFSACQCKSKVNFITVLRIYVM